MSVPVAVPPAEVATPATGAARLADYAQLARPKIAAMVLVTTLLGALLAGPADARTLLLVLAGTALVSAGASAFNQLLERRTDARMRRTENRPLPAGRLSPAEVAVVGAGATVLGAVLLALLASGPAALVVAGLTFASYVFAYTPAKSRTWWNTFIGAVPGAAPPLIGWAAVTGSLAWAALPLFLVLFFWQVPHFLAIAWIYRDDYRRAGLAMLPVQDAAGARTARTMIGHTVLLLAASLLPAAWGAGPLYLAGAAALGLGFLALTWSFRSDRSVTAARRVLKMSLVYLPAVLLLLFCDRLV